MPDFPLPNIPRPTPRVPRRRPLPDLPPAPSRSARAKLKREVSAARKKVRVATEAFYDVGTQLNAWKKSKSWRALGNDNFKSFVRAHVMPYSTAARLMGIAATYPKAMATKLGIEKANQLRLYAKLVDSPAKVLAQRDAKLGNPGRRISELSAQDIEGLVAGLRMSAARSAAPKVTRDDKRVARIVGRRFEAELGVDMDVRIDKKRNKLCLELDLDQARDVV